MKITSDDLNIIKVLEENEPGKWLEDRELKYLDLSNNKISLKDNDAFILKEDPEMMLRIIRLSGEIIVDIDNKTIDAIKERIDLLHKIPRNIRRDHFVGIVTSNDAEKALGYVRDTNALVFLFGDTSYRTASRRTLQDIDIIIDNMNKARPEIEHRLTLFLRTFKKDQANQILNYLIWNKEEGSQILHSLKYVDKIYFLNTKLELKKFIKKIGYDNYSFIDKIARQERMIFDRMNYKIEARHYMLQEILNYNEPFSVEHLVINADDLLSEGIAKDRNQAEELLNQVLDLVITKPKLNEKNILFKKAEQIKNNPFIKHTRKVWWRK